MPKISAIKPQIKRPDRYSIFIDGKYIFSLSEAELLNLGLRRNQEFTADQLRQLKVQAVVDKGYDRALNLISHRMRSEWELREYLRRKDYDEVTSDVIVDRLHQRGYIDDEVFARRWVESRRLLKATSRRRLQQELNQKRIDADIIRQVLDQDETDEAIVLAQLVAKKRQQSKYQDDLKLMQFLARQGFGYEAIKVAMTGETDND